MGRCPESTLNASHPIQLFGAACGSSLGSKTRTSIFLFLGRLTGDKGVILLARAWQRIVSAKMGGYLVIVGPDDEGLLNLALLKKTERMVVVDETWKPERYLKAADVLCLPSRREGFGNVIIEAACAAVPAIASRIYGVIDAVDDGRTGLLFPVDDVDSLTACMMRLLTDSDTRLRLGEAARDRAVKEFSQEVVADALMRVYAEAVTPT